MSKYRTQVLGDPFPNKLEERWVDGALFGRRKDAERHLLALEFAGEDRRRPTRIVEVDA